ncbi:MAG: hypothetical protein ACRDPO_16145 [Streptosporangiaceae bacterium]
MIRRGFWLVTGAALGVTGYRRAGRLLQSFRPHQAGQVVLRAPGPRAPALLSGRRVLAGAARAGRGAAASAAFVRDVREGVAEYLDQQDSGAGRTLESQPGSAGRGRPAS